MIWRVLWSWRLGKLAGHACWLPPGIPRRSQAINGTFREEPHRGTGAAENNLPPRHKRGRRAQTTTPLAWIVQRLAVGSCGYLTWLLYRHSHKI